MDLFPYPQVLQLRVWGTRTKIFSSRTPDPKLFTSKLEGTGTNPRPRIRPQEEQKLTLFFYCASECKENDVTNITSPRFCLMIREYNYEIALT